VNHGKALMHDDIMRDAILKGLAMKGVWQAKEIENMGKIPIIFFDEPYLSDFGSAFVPLERTKVIEMLNDVIHILKQKIKYHSLICFMMNHIDYQQREF